MRRKEKWNKIKPQRWQGFKLANDEKKFSRKLRQTQQFPDYYY